MSRLFVMSCPWQKVTEYSGQQDTEGVNINSVKTERFGTCYGAQCPFFDNINENCRAVKNTNHITAITKRPGNHTIKPGLFFISITSAAAARAACRQVTGRYNFKRAAPVNSLRITPEDIS